MRRQEDLSITSIYCMQTLLIVLMRLYQIYIHHTHVTLVIKMLSFTSTRHLGFDIQKHQDVLVRR